MDMDQKIDRSIGFHKVMHAKPYLHLYAVFYTDKKVKKVINWSIKVKRAVPNLFPPSSSLQYS